MQTMTLTEQTLARLWASTPDNSSSWYDRFERFADIARLMHSEERYDAAALFESASEQALHRSIYQMSLPRSSGWEVAA